MQTYYLDPIPDGAKQVIAASFPSYRGRKVRVRLIDGPMNLRSYWSGGSRDYYVILRADGERYTVPAQSGFDPTVAGLDRVEVPVGFLVIEHTIFCGKDLGITIHVPVAMVPKWLPGPVDMPPDCRIVLRYTGSLKASYNGDNQVRFHEATRETGITRERWDTAKTDCIERKWLTRAGAITAAGRNALTT